MAGEDKDQKTEQPTARRLSEARDEGQVAMSQELIAALALCSGFAVLSLAGNGVWERSGEILVRGLRNLGDAGRADMDAVRAAGWLRGALSAILGPLGLLLAPVLVMMALVGYGQVGFRFTPKAVRLDPNKINPIKGFSRLFSARSTVRTLLSGVKILTIGGVMGFVASRQIPEVVQVGTSQLGPLLKGMAFIAMRCTGAALLAILALALLDFAFQRWQFQRDMRMSKQEIKEEQKLTDGDPQMRGRIRQMQREMATRRMMDDVPKATVVITNPTHYAVALRYERDEPGEPGAPRVLAKGAGYVALRIKQIAAEHGVECHEDVPLARALYAQAEVGSEIPTELFAAVAAVLARIYRLRGDTPSTATA